MASKNNATKSKKLKPHRAINLAKVPEDKTLEAQIKQAAQDVVDKLVPPAVASGYQGIANKDLKDAKDAKSKPADEQKKCGYDFTKRLGLGAYGAVWSVYPLIAGDSIRLAYKELLVPQDDIEFGEYNPKEMDIMARLRHPNIMPLVALTTPNTADCKRYGLVMPLGQGDLTSRFKQEVKTASTEKTIDYTLPEKLMHMFQVAQGLKFLHQSGAVHCDLKPVNFILLNGQAVISDFGLAQYIDVTKPNKPFKALAYTISYRPPECFGANAMVYGASSDIWAMGSCFVDILTERSFLMVTMSGGEENMLPFFESIRASSDLGLWLMRRTGMPQDPEIIRLLVGMLAYKPEDRWTIDQVLASPAFTKLGLVASKGGFLLPPKKICINKAKQWIPDTKMSNNIIEVMDLVIGTWSNNVPQFMTTEMIYLAIDLFYRALEAKITEDDLMRLIRVCLWTAAILLERTEDISLFEINRWTGGFNSLNKQLIALQSKLFTVLEGRLYRPYLYNAIHYGPREVVARGAAIELVKMPAVYLDVDLDKWTVALLAKP